MRAGVIVSHICNFAHHREFCNSDGNTYTERNVTMRADNVFFN